MQIHIKRIYDPPADTDGLRVLVDRLWPRGVKRADARIDLWCKQLAPSDQLRRWFGHQPQRWAEFQHRYRLELENSAEAADEFLASVEEGHVTLLYAAADKQHNHAIVLTAWLQNRAATS